MTAIEDNDTYMDLIHYGMVSSYDENDLIFDKDTVLNLLEKATFNQRLTDLATLLVKRTPELPYIAQHMENTEYLKDQWVFRLTWEKSMVSDHLGVQDFVRFLDTYPTDKELYEILLPIPKRKYLRKKLQGLAPDYKLYYIDGQIISGFVVGIK